MNKAEEYILSAYEESGTLDKNGRVKLCFCQTDKKVYVKKIVDSATGEIYKKVKDINSKSFPIIKELVECDNYCIVIEEYIKGDTINELIRNKGVFEKDRAKEYIAKVCTGVDILHKNGIVHRDITGGNVMLTEGGNIKIIDFNISHKADKSKTKDTVVMGTEGYAAPEQFGFLRSDERTDIYAIGILLNFMLTGTTELGSYVDSDNLKEVIEECTQFLPDNRYKSCQEITKALQQRLFKPWKIHKAYYVGFACELIMIIGFINSGSVEDFVYIFHCFVMFVFPIFVFCNFRNWQERIGLNKASKAMKTTVCTIIYVTVLLTYIALFA